MKKYDEIISNEISNLKKKELKTFKSYHIFYRLFESIRPQLAFDEEQFLLWYFFSVEKALKVARKTQAGYCNYILSDIENYQIENNKLLNNVLHFVYEPAKAFYEYKMNGNYANAINNLDNSIDCIGNLVKSGYPFMLSASVEQNINICRVVFRNNARSGISEFNFLNDYLLFGFSATNQIKIGTKEDLLNLSSDEHIALVNFNTNEFLNKIMHDGNISNLIDLIWNHLNEDLLVRRSVYFEYYIRAAIFIKESFLGKINESIDRNIEILSNLNILPSMLQYLFLKMFLKVYCPNNPSIELAINEFAFESLGVKKMMDQSIEKYSIDVQSPIRLS